MLIPIIFYTVYLAYVNIVVLDKTNIAILNEYMDKLQKESITDYNLEDYKFVISEVVDSNKSVVKESLLFLTVIFSFVSTALINAFMNIAKQKDELEEKAALLKQNSLKSQDIRLNTKKL